jgi:succinate dehydrogenase/fumarate reductase cytochrome b subunit
MPLEARLRPRPLSPHLTIYRRKATMMMSIAHRPTGAALYAGTLLWRSNLIRLPIDIGPLAIPDPKGTTRILYRGH